MLQIFWIALCLACSLLIAVGLPSSAAQPYSLDYPWHKYKLTVPATSKIKDLSISMRQCNPVMAEYEFKVSGILANSRYFEVPLQTQCGGTACLTMDFYPVPKTDGVIVFKLQDGEYPAQAVDLSTGLLTGFSSLCDQTSVSLGFLGPHVNYNKPNLWNKWHVIADLALHHGDAKASAQLARRGLAEARRLRDRELIATSLTDLARANERAKLGSDSEIESLYFEALENATDRYKPRTDGAITRNKTTILMGLSGFYFRKSKLSESEKADSKSIESCQKMIRVIERDLQSSAAKNTCGTTDGAIEQLNQYRQAVKYIEMEQVRIKLLQNKPLEAEASLLAIEAKHGRLDFLKRLGWTPIYMSIAMLESDICSGLRSDPLNTPYSITVTFEVKSDGIIDKMKFRDCKGIPPAIGQYVAMFAIMGASPFRSKTAFPENPTICTADINYAESGSSVSIRKPSKVELEEFTQANEKKKSESSPLLRHYLFPNAKP